ncbi:MAG: restriction endonuclease subunit S [Hydrogenophaga sp.]|nr:restriction endonuclease subunit S [Hydrogenophaga sp.]
MSDRLAAEVMSRPLAKGWQWIPLGQYVENLDGRRVPVSQKERETRRGDFPYYGASGVIDTIDGHTHDGEFVLIGEDGANLLTRSKPIAFQAKGKIWVNNHAHVLRCKPGFSNAYLAYYINSIDLSPYVTGTAQPKLSQSMMNKIPVPVAPPDQQIRIVEEIDKQFSRLDEAVANLQRVKANLKRYKAAVLKAAVEGRLVETEASLARREGRGYETAAERIGKTPTPPRPNRFNSRTGDVIYGHGALAVGIPAVSVPEGWQWVNLVEIAKMESGHTPSRNHPEWWDGDVPWIGIADARDHHEQVILRTLQNTNEDGLANSAARLLPAGTVCVSRTASVGYVVVMGRPMATSQDFVNWVPTSAVTSDWLRIVFSADREALIRFGKGSVHKTIYFPEWLSASIALPPLAEQVRIAAEVDRRVSVLRSVEAEVEANLRRAEALRQATLEKAFSAGEKNA